MERDVPLTASDNFIASVLGAQEGAPDLPAKYTNPLDMARSGKHEEHSLFTVDQDDVLSRAAMAIGQEKVANILGSVPPANAVDPNVSKRLRKLSQVAAEKNHSYVSSEESGPSVSMNQWTAIQKYGSLVDFLGSKDGDALAAEMMTHVNKILAQKIEDNTRDAISKMKNPVELMACVANRKNIKQFFRGDDWVCSVTASGPFVGNESFAYDRSSEKHYIMRKEGKRYIDVTAEFNVVSEVEAIPEGVESDIPEDAELE